MFWKKTRKMYFRVQISNVHIKKNSLKQILKKIYCNDLLSTDLKWFRDQRRWVSEWLLVNDNSAFFSAILWRYQVNFQWDDDEVRFVLDQHAELYLFCASSLRQQSTGRYVAPLEHIILIPGRPVFALSYLYCVLSREATNNNFIDFGLTWPWTYDLPHSRRER